MLRPEDSLTLVESISKLALATVSRVERGPETRRSRAFMESRPSVSPVALNASNKPSTGLCQGGKGVIFCITLQSAYIWPIKRWFLRRAPLKCLEMLTTMFASLLLFPFPAFFGTALHFLACYCQQLLSTIIINYQWESFKLATGHWSWSISNWKDDSYS